MDASSPPPSSEASPPPSPAFPLPLDSLLSSSSPAPANPFRYGEFPTAGRLPHSLSSPFTEHCAFKAATNAVMGAGLGVVWGVFTTSMGTGVNSFGVQPGQPGWVDPATLTTRESLRLTYRDMARASKSSARSFGLIGGVYTATECTIEKARGRHDLTNAIAAGCLTGGMLAARGGPQATAIGCAGFAAFGYAMDRFMGT